MYIKVEGLKKSYATETLRTEVLKGVDLELADGEIGVILGPSGSGKSTLMNIIGGVDRADSGKVVVDGMELTALDDNALCEYRRAQVGFIFQFYNLIPNLTALENIEVVAEISRAPLAVDEVLAAVELADKKRSFPKELSGGEQQRAAIARAIVKNPKLLLCDEPTGALDFETALGTLKLLAHINREFHTTILIITHNAAIAEMANRVFKLRGGEITESFVNKTIVSPEEMHW